MTRSAILLLGPSGCGKSTLAQALRNMGATAQIFHQHGESEAYDDDVGPEAPVRLSTLMGVVEVRFDVGGHELRLVCHRSMEPFPSLLAFLHAESSEHPPAWPERAARALIGLYPELSR